MEEITEAARALEREAGFPHDYLERVRSAVRSSATRWSPANPREAALLVARRGIFDVDAPTASPRRGAGIAKRAVKGLTAWYFRYLEEQMNAFGQAVAGLGETLAATLEGLEARLSEATQKLEELQSRIDRLEGKIESRRGQC
ncbi:MAG: hypothetical protein ACRDJF_10800 [Actinomycetota bacterium]